jgi:hypothetical protein
LPELGAAPSRPSQRWHHSRARALSLPPPTACATKLNASPLASHWWQLHDAGARFGIPTAPRPRAPLGSLLWWRFSSRQAAYKTVHAPGACLWLSVVKPRASATCSTG